MLARERMLLRALPEEPFPYWEEALVRVDQKGLVCVRQNRYSVPVASPACVCARASQPEITILHEGTEVARDERLRGRFWFAHASSTTSRRAPQARGAGGVARPAPGARTRVLA